ncbi:Transcriptional regulator GlxA family, contains an amidase domain and an AraC-type DNA-binding HTH domain [Bradyrhizobium sp. Rc2d]|uniref:GlxA family transcriptional regulator n=1 Tax=Bradyrhizobium sp. Rc2d TaxID=1855321 RepID=UPI0008840FDD|nr:GlxA family transcriptional regulator [Bradyrhizobium sp. Rc2d]SDH46718.1 Transcriptional regulator GlxA family, contains an amidase domain and an AraC-type DNA-binding HTH domain [Bradyrhizobium sp. Rc2d]
MRIALLAPAGVQSLDIVGPAEVFWEAARRLGDPSAYNVQLIAGSAGPVRGTGGLRFVADRHIFDPDEPIDTLLVGGDPSFATVDPAMVQWLRRRAGTVRRLGSVCTGVFLLAAAGLLDGKRVTTHWECATRLRNEYPKLNIDSDQIFIRDGNLFTTAGVTAGMDLALALVEEDHGRELALIVARYMVMFLKRPGGQSQFSAHLAAQMSGKSKIQQVQQYVLDNLTAPLSVDNLAERAGMSVRNFTRVFRQEMNMTPSEFVDAARLDAARLLLEDSAKSLQQVAIRCGFGNADGMRRAFVRNIGIGPGEYRLRFRSAWAPANHAPPSCPPTNRP